MERKIGCLVIHGFGGSIREVKPLVAALQERGFITRCPALRGHTGNTRDLADVSYTDWIAGAEEELDKLTRECDEVFIAGFSMGGLIGMQLARNHRISGLITINTPIYYWDIKKILSNIVHDILSKDYSNINRYLKPSNRLPLKALWNFRLLLGKSKKLVKELKAPLMIAQAIDDDVVQHRSAGYIYTHAPASIKKLATYVRGGHVLLLSETCHALIRDIFYFLEENKQPDILLPLSA